MTATVAMPSTVEFGTRRILVVAGIMLAALLGRIDGTIVNVALPTIQGNIGASFDEATWIIIGYLMANVVVIPLTPWLAVRFGRRQLFVTSIIGFTALSFLCATSTNVQELIIFRVLQGMFAGGIDATANSVLTSTFPPSKIGLAQSVFSLSAACAPPIGLLLGGVLTDQLSWQWCFLINVPLGAIAAVLIRLLLKNPDQPVATILRPPFDAVGVALLAVGPSLLIYFVSEGDRYDWFGSSSVATACVVGALATIGFVVWELRGARVPIVDLRIFRYRRVAIGAVLILGMAFVYLSTMVFLPQYAQEVLGYTPTQCGLMILMRAVPLTLMVPVAGTLAASGKFDLRFLIFGGFIVMAGAGYWQGLVMTPGSDFAALFLPLALAGIGNAFTFSPLFLAIIGGVPHADRGKANAIISVTIQLGGALATAILVSTLHVRTVFHQAILASNVVLSNVAVAQFVHHGSITVLNAIVESQSRALSYADISVLIAVVAILTAPFALFLGRRAG